MPESAKKFTGRKRPRSGSKPVAVHEAKPKRLSATARGYNYRWQKASKQYLNSNPLCVECDKTGRTQAATCVDHIKPHKGDTELFWNESNWQSLCDSCHSRKTRRGE